MNLNFLSKIIDEYDTPIYLLNLNELKKNLNDFRVAFKELGTAFAMAYPFKTNSTAEIITYFLNEGCWAEVSSEEELQKAVNLKLASEEIIYNSPYKRMTSLKKAIKLGCRIHVDNFEELERIIQISASRQIDLRIGIRISIQGSKWEKFGFTIGRETDDLLEIVSKEKRITINSFHIHQSNLIDLNYYRKHIKAIFDF